MASSQRPRWLYPDPKDQHFQAIAEVFQGIAVISEKHFFSGMRAITGHHGTQYSATLTVFCVCLPGIRRARAPASSDNVNALSGSMTIVKCISPPALPLHATALRSYTHVVVRFILRVSGQLMIEQFFESTVQ
ncbi:hypothetical protein LAD67_16085 [Escherichia coli]|nr:hypothetical protein [Escherichia coli]